MYRWVEHTGELELSIDGADEPAVFADAFAAFAELASDGGPSGVERRQIELRSDERDTLLADWLDELVYLADAMSFVPDELGDLAVGGGRLRATVIGHEGDPSPLVKAVTRHRLAFEPVGGRWHACVVLDV